MLQKPDLDKVKLPEEIDLVRLDTVWRVIEGLGWLKSKTPVVVKLEKELPENRGNVSAFLGGKRAMSTNFYNTFMKKYGIDVPNKAVARPVDHGDEEEITEKKDSVSTLSDANKEASIANRILAENQRELIAMLKANFYAPSKISESLNPFFQKVSQSLANKYRLPADEVLVELGKLFVEGLIEKKQQGTSGSAHSTSK